MSKIAKKAKIGIGTLYVYFESKEALVNALYQGLKNKGSLSVIDQVQGMPVKLQLMKVWEHTLRYRIKNHAEMIFMEQFLNSSFISEKSKHLSNQFINYLGKLLKTGQEQMFIKSLDETILINLLTGYSRQLASHLVSNKTPITKQVIEESFSLCWDAIKA
jgi:AcrR family transcriptional regulator